MKDSILEKEVKNNKEHDDASTIQAEIELFAEKYSDYHFQNLHPDSLATKESLKEECLAAFKMESLKNSLSEAIIFLRNNSPHLLDQISKETVNQETLTEIEKRAIQNYLDKEFSVSSTLFYLLTSLAPTHFSYWMRLGVSEQAQSKHKEAILSFENGMSLFSNYIPLHLFLWESYLDTGDLHLAELERTFIKEHLTQPTFEDSWKIYFKFLEAKTNEATR